MSIKTLVERYTSIDLCRLTWLLKFFRFRMHVTTHLRIPHIIETIGTVAIVMLAAFTAYQHGIAVVTVLALSVVALIVLVVVHRLSDSKRSPLYDLYLVFIVLPFPGTIPLLCLCAIKNPCWIAAVLIASALGMNALLQAKRQS